MRYYNAVVKARQAAHFMFMEDDMELCPHGMQALHHAIGKASAYAPMGWSALRVSYGMNGVVLPAQDLPIFADYLMSRLVDRPPDHVVVEWFAAETDKARAYLSQRRNMAFRHNLFLHLGKVSSIAKGDRSTPSCFEELGALMVDVEKFDITGCADDDISPCFGRQGPPKVIEWTKYCSANAPTLQPQMIVPLASNVQPVAGNQGETCDTVCGRQGKACRQDQLAALNNCDQLRKLFGCENGCSMFYGLEQPCYVSDATAPAENLPRTCLINSKVAESTCGASHHMTSRICPCA